MATRRSRLQIKPNIGGPKVAPKPQKTPVSVAKPKVADTTNEASTAGKNKTSDPAIPITTDVNPEAQNTETDNLNNTNVSSDAKENEETNKAPVQETVKETEKDADKGGTESVSTGPARARMRRFGKVNIGAAAARGKPQTETAKDKPEKDSPQPKPPPDKSSTPVKSLTPAKPSTPVKSPLNSPVKTAGNTQDEKTFGSTDEKAAPGLPARRSRFPKAKPNVADVVRKKARKESDETEKENEKSKSNKDPKEPVPIINISPPSEEPSTKTSVTSKPTLNIPATPGSSAGISDGHSLLSPRATTASLPPKSPLKSPAPNISGLSPMKTNAEKRARTVSISEPVPAKKPRRIKVEAPPDQPPDRATMRMRDIIHWNPTNNPMKVKEKGSVKVVRPPVEKENDREEAGPDTAGAPADEEGGGADNNSALPVPQVTIGPDGNIVVNEKSLVVRDPELDKAASQEDDVIDETDLSTTYSSFRKNTRSKPWSQKDTTKFYKALAMLGIDFFLIQQLFPKRTRTEIKKKFQKEERINRELIEKVLTERIKFDENVFDKESSEEEEVPVKPVKQKKEKKKKQKKEQKKNKPQRKSKNETTMSEYFDGLSPSEEEGDESAPAHNRANEDPTWEPPGVSTKDGEVVDILMELSEGRSAGNSKATKSLKTMLDNKRKNNPKNSSSTVTSSEEGGDTTMKMPVSITIDDSETSGNGGRVVLNQPISSSTLSGNAQQAISIASGQSLLAGNPSTYFAQNVASVQIPQNPQQSTEQPMQSVLPSTSGVNQSKPAAMNIPPQGIAIQPQSMLNIGSSTSADGATHTMFGMPQTIDGDQYVLVTVIPEGGGETVIHIYRLHNGAQVPEGAEPMLTPNMLSGAMPVDQTASVAELAVPSGSMQNVATIQNIDPASVIQGSNISQDKFQPVGDVQPMGSSEAPVSDTVSQGSSGNLSTEMDTSELVVRDTNHSIEETEDKISKIQSETIENNQTENTETENNDEGIETSCEEFTKLKDRSINQTDSMNIENVQLQTETSGLVAERVVENDRNKVIPRIVPRNDFTSIDNLSGQTEDFDFSSKGILPSSDESVSENHGSKNEEILVATQIESNSNEGSENEDDLNFTYNSTVSEEEIRIETSTSASPAIENS